MSRNSARIRAGLQALSNRPYEIMGGTVVAGSLNETTNTVSVLPYGRAKNIEGVSLSSVSGEDSGLIVVPKDGSDVIFGCVNGPGIWTVLKTGEAKSILFKIANATCVVSEDGAKISRGETVIEIGTLIKISTAGEDLSGILGDLITAIKAITLPTPSGTSGTPINFLTFDTISTRLGNLLTS